MTRATTTCAQIIYSAAGIDRVLKVVIQIAVVHFQETKRLLQDLLLRHGIKISSKIDQREEESDGERSGVVKTVIKRREVSFSRQQILIITPKCVEWRRTIPTLSSIEKICDEFVLTTAP